MKILLDANHYIIGYCDIGDIENAIDVETVPEDFSLFYSAYQYIDNAYILDNTKKEQIINEMKGGK